MVSARDTAGPVNDCADRIANTMEQFHSAASFNQDLFWDTTKVTDMGKMFASADTFNGDVSTWNVANVVTMEQMFQFATFFQARNGLSNWNVASVSETDEMFFGAVSFGGIGASSWTPSALEDARLMVRLLPCDLKNLVIFLTVYRSLLELRRSIKTSVHGNRICHPCLRL
jgi:Mycoplasma protein of unknown function, DUF285